MAIALADKVVLLHRGLGRATIPHAFGGALALAYYTAPRATIDIDVNVFVGSDKYERVRRALAKVGVDTIPDKDAVVERGQLRSWWGSTPVDVFFAYDLIHEEMRARSRVVPFGDARIPILAPEHLLVVKAVFDRPKDWIDIEEMLVAVDDVDLVEIRRWMAHLVRSEDPRARRVEELIEDLRG